MEALGPRFFAQAAAAVDVPWGMNVANDRHLTEPGGHRALGARLLRWYLGRLHVAARREPAAALGFIMVAGLIAPPASPFRDRSICTSAKGPRMPPPV